MATLPHPPVLLISDRGQADRSLPRLAEAAFQGGCRWFSLREKDLGVDEQIALARELSAVAARFSAGVMLHGKAEVAREAGLSAVHLPRDGDIARARGILGEAAWISISTHDRVELTAAAAAGADAATLSPVFESASKPGYSALGEERFQSLIEGVQIPVLALGGVTAENAGVCRRMGAAGIAVMGAVMRAADPKFEAERLIGAWRRG